MRINFSSAALAALSLAATVTAAPAELVKRQSTVKIMALGDSITGSPGCWRAYLWQKLQQAGIKNTDFVGTLAGQGCGFPYDGENEGHGGFLAVNIANQNQLPGWLSSTKPDIVIMHLGTNDVWNNRPPAQITTAFSKLVDQMRASKASMKILVAKIIPMKPSNCAECGARVVALNSAIGTWAAAKNTSSSTITVVDAWTGFDTVSMTGDGVHPNDAGNRKLADTWFQPLASAIRGLKI
ncbi:carbohydrate esterase family 3 protein [Cucurbitaria berberidis CBS 394.84]|uniref:Carbohydrate esterase family 3 protein n=1 Tax=Cucurbitaria berberidis CBS 394.84 TaxID=1168544 RepID=A0A9P4GF82_9PLEO|nr:carbohydrate esterase family 3 protein [Cucurbitaria berberidis CBS 394.84]KAF1844953.1 carbohydrate esterase family 3 protein [Cucurbitaria berberidis CBS 394.84]